MKIDLSPPQALQVEKIVKARKANKINTCQTIVARELINLGLKELKKNPGELSLYA